MAIYRIYPISDTTLYSETPLSNTGLDEIVEIGAYTDFSNSPQLSRVLVKYDINEINSILSTHNISQPISASIKLQLADAYELPKNFGIETYPVAEPWDIGTGKFGDVPVNDSGVSWSRRLVGRSGSWDLTGSISGVTGSYSNVVYGGGTWIYEYSGSSMNSTLSLNPKSDLDIDIDISNILSRHLTGSIENNGLIIKLDTLTENSYLSNTRIKFFGRDTNTIYPPYIELRWNDFSYVTGSLNLLDTSISTVKLTNNRGTYIRDEKIKIRLSCRPKYPVRTFTTSSSYLINNALPTSSYWGLRDEHTNDTIVDFSEFTRISCDAKSPYFTMYMNTLQPERYYRLLVKTELDGSSVIIDSKENIFKVVRNV